MIIIIMITEFIPADFFLWFGKLEQLNSHNDSHRCANVHSKGQHFLFTQYGAFDLVKKKDETS